MTAGCAVRVLLPVLLVAAHAALIDAGSQQRPVFRSRSDLVSIDVSVRRGNVPVTGLTAPDFRVFDNGVLQKVDSVSYEAVPIDVTFFLDTSPSLSGLLEELKRDIAKISGMLRPADRLRLLTFDYQVTDVFGWQASGGDLKLETARMGRISSVYDAIFLSLMWRPDVDRRHLVIAMTDGIDAGSFVDTKQLLEISRRAEAVLHIVRMGSTYDLPKYLPMPWVPIVSDGQDFALREVAERTGGKEHSAFFGRTSVVNAFNQAFEDFRQSYIVRYVPTGTPRDGWHEIKVEVARPERLTIRARKGYFGS